MVAAKDKLHEVLFTYGPMGILLSREQNKRQVRFHYDKNLQLDAIINEGNEIYTFWLDGRGEVIKEKGFDGLTRTYIRDGAGRVVKVNRPGGKWTEYRYDGVGNVIEETHSDGTRSAYRYDPDGLLLEAAGEEGNVLFKRNRKGFLLQEIQGEHSISHEYDKNGRETRLTSTLGADLKLDYDSDGELTSMQAANNWRIDWKRDNTGLEIFRQLSGGIAIRTERDRFGREIRKSIGVRNVEQSRVSYDWGIGNRLQGIYTDRGGSHTHTRFDYDAFDNLIRADYTELSKQTETIYRAPDIIGNLYEKPDRKDRRYSEGGKLLEDPVYHYHYDLEGNLIFKEFKQGPEEQPYVKEWLKEKYNIRCKATAKGWIYEWTDGGMLRKVINPEGGRIRFGYDPLGRRLWKETGKCRTHWLWNGNVPLHEWETINREPLIHLVTWVFENGSFVPCGRITSEGSQSIVTDYLGTPTEMYDQKGRKTWQASLDIYGRVRTFEGRSLSDCPFRYQGQYQDKETGLYYNRFRYYDPDTGTYISQDPIRLAGANPTLYSYVGDVNKWLDIFGLHVTYDENLAHMARQVHDEITDPYKHRNSTVSIAEVEINGNKTLYASGNGATLSPKQREKLIELGVPAENIFSGKKYKQLIPNDKMAEKLANHAERVIIRNVPSDAKFTGKWGISWGGNQKNASCKNCIPFVNKVSKGH